MNLYAESSAVLAWLLDEDSGELIRGHLADAQLVISSDLTLIECDRVLRRAAALGELTEGEAADRRAHLATTAAGWHMLRIAGEIVDRAREPFPCEPIRSLDAIHLASALTGRAATAGLAVLSLDERLRASASQLGFRVLPAEAQA